MVGRKKLPSKTKFGEELSKLMADANVSPQELSANMGVSESYVYGVARGTRNANPQFVASVMSAMPDLTERQELKMNLAAAQDAGYNLNLDLPEDW